MKLIIGIDDTDNLESRGTGHLARQLAHALESSGLTETQNVTRHQLLVNPQIPYTSHNSSASLVVEALKSIEEISSFCCTFVSAESAEGSDTGVCVCSWDLVSDEIKDWGTRAKNVVLTLAEAHSLAEKYGVFLIGLTGHKIGVIGSLAAVGLRAAGNDGRILWLRNLRELTGVFTREELLKVLQIDSIQTTVYKEILENDRIQITDWTRPIVRKNKITLLVEPVNGIQNYEFISASKEFIKSITE